MCPDIVSENGTSFKVLTFSVALLTSLLLLTSVVYASSNVRIWMEKDTFVVGERASIQFDFPRNGSYTLVQLEPRRSTIVRDRNAKAGRNSLSGTIDTPTGRKTIKVIFEDYSGNTYTASTSYYVESRDQSEGRSQNGSEDKYSLSYFENRDPSQGSKAAMDLQNQVRVIRPGESGYRQLRHNFERKAGSRDFSREQQNSGSIEFNFGSSGMEFSMDQSKDDADSLKRSLNNQGATFFGSKGDNNYLLMDGMYDFNPDDNDNGGGSSGGSHPGGGHCICRLPCSCTGCCSPIFICVPGWMPWPLPPQWIMWILLMT